MKSILKCGQCTPCMKHVSFDGCRQEYPIDDIDRSPVPVTRSLSYNDILELKQLKIHMMAPRSERSYCRGVPVALLPLLPSQDTPTPPTPPPRPASAPPVDSPTPLPSLLPSLLPPSTQQSAPPRRKFNFSFLPVVAPMTSASSTSTPESSAPSSPALHSQQDPADSIPTISSALPTPDATPETTALPLISSPKASSEPLPPSTHSSPVLTRVQPPSPAAEHGLGPGFPGTALTPPATPQHTSLNLGFSNPQSIDVSEPPDSPIAAQQCKPITYLQTSLATSTTSSVLQAAS